MKDNIRFKHFYVKPTLPEALAPLMELAQNLWSTWDPDAFRLFSRIDPILFRKYDHNPLKLLQEVTPQRLEELAENAGFMNEMSTVYVKFTMYQNYEGFFTDDEGEKHRYPDDMHVAYFSMEYGLHESLPVYSGGLGILSGDHLKAASDLGIPLTGFGLLYRYGYFNQRISLEGIQQEEYMENEWYSKPIEKVKNADGTDLTFSIMLRGEEIFIKAWITHVGKVPLYLLDTNLEQNKPHHRTITDHLYVADREMRILQEIVLAFGGMQLMQLIDLQPSVYHLNEGHSAFLIIKRLRNLVCEKGFSFDEAMDLIRTSSVFTTHTPVPAGNEAFDMRLVRFYLEEDISACGMSFDQFSRFAVIPGNDQFNMSVLAIRFSSHINGVSKLHSDVSKEMWHPIYPALYEDEMPISAITNGVHVQSWLSRQMARLFDRYLGSDYQHKGEEAQVWANVMSIPEIEVWEAHRQRKEQLISFVRQRLQNSLAYRGAATHRVNSILNPDYLLIGFARRFATYKRGNLILRDKERLLRLIRNEDRPVQFIFAGKAHPADEHGKAMIKSIIDFTREEGIDHRFVFLENYDINIGRHLVQGVDVWLNNPIKPNEASGTSGMKAGMNGALNLSVLDGWWPECYTPDNGWAIRAGEGIEEAHVRDTLESNEIYDLLENEVARLYYDQDDNGLPRKWIEKMKHSIHDVGMGFNMHRMLREYLNDFYLPGSSNVRDLTADDFGLLHTLKETQDAIRTYWDAVQFDDLQINVHDNEQIYSGKQLTVNAVLEIADAPDDLFRVEVFYKTNPTSWQLIPLEFIQREGTKAHYSVTMRVQGTGKQSVNIRVRPRRCCFKDFENYIKWYR